MTEHTADLLERDIVSAYIGRYATCYKNIKGNKPAVQLAVELIGDTHQELCRAKDSLVAHFRPLNPTALPGFREAWVSYNDVPRSSPPATMRIVGRDYFEAPRLDLGIAKHFIGAASRHALSDAEIESRAHKAGFVKRTVVYLDMPASGISQHALARQIARRCDELNVCTVWAPKPNAPEPRI